MIENKVLISLKLMSGKSPERFQDFFAQLSYNWVEISSVYRVFRQAESFQGLRWIRGEEHLDGFSAVALARISLSPQEVIADIQRVETQLSDQRLKRTMSANCLIYGDKVIRTPALTLPHPEFHLNPEEVVPAAELLPDYTHPILNKTLSQLANGFQSASWGEYYGPGKEYI